MTLITIGIPVYNEEKNIVQLLKSIKYQKEIIVKKILIYNDGSTDKTEELIINLIQADSWMKESVFLHTAEKNQGKASALRWIFSQSTEDLLCIIDSDMILENKLVLKKLTAPFLDSSVGLSIGWYYYKAGFSGIQYVLEFSSEVLKRLGKSKSLYIASGAIMCLRKENVNKMNIPEKITRIDAYIYLKTIQNKFRHVFCPDATVFDTKDFSKLSFSWFTQAQQRVHVFPQIFQEIFSQEFLEDQQKTSLLLKIKVIIPLIFKHPVRFIIYILYKFSSIIVGFSLKKASDSYLWRKTS